MDYETVENAFKKLLCHAVQIISKNYKSPKFHRYMKKLSSKLGALMKNEILLKWKSIIEIIILKICS